MKELQTARSLRYMRKRLMTSLCSMQQRPILLKVYCDCRMQLQRFRITKPWLTISTILPSEGSLPPFRQRSAQRKVSMLMMKRLRYWQQKEMMFWWMNSRYIVSSRFDCPSSFSQEKMQFSTYSPTASMNSLSQVFFMIPWANAKPLMRCTSLVDRIFLRINAVSSLRLCWGSCPRAVLGALLLMLMLMWLLRVGLMLILMLTLLFSLGREGGKKSLEETSRMRLITISSWDLSTRHYSNSFQNSLLPKRRFSIAIQLYYNPKATPTRLRLKPILNFAYLGNNL